MKIIKTIFIYSYKNTLELEKTVLFENTCDYLRGGGGCVCKSANQRLNYQPPTHQPDNLKGAVIL
jgi:hypothetical protein